MWLPRLWHQHQRPVCRKQPHDVVPDNSRMGITTLWKWNDFWRLPWEMTLLSCIYMDFGAWVKNVNCLTSNHENILVMEAQFRRFEFCRCKCCVVSFIHWPLYPLHKGWGSRRTVLDISVKRKMCLSRGIELHPVCNNSAIKTAVAWSTLCLMTVSKITLFTHPAFQDTLDVEKFWILDCWSQFGHMFE